MAADTSVSDRSASRGGTDADASALSLRKRRMTVLGLSLLIVGGALIIWQLNFGSGPSRPTVVPGQMAYFSDDDGRTWFPDAIGRVPPFKHNGRDAVRVQVCRCPGGQPFAGYLVRCTRDGLKTVRESDPLLSGRRFRAAVPPVFEVKRPGAGPWVPVGKDNLADWQRIIDVQCPGGDAGSGQPVMVFPEGG